MDQPAIPADEKPLQGCRIVVTRAVEQAGELAARLETLGAQVLLLPLVEFAPPEDFAPLDRAIRQIERFDWVVITSRNVVEFVGARARAIGVDLPARLSGANSRPLVAAVGQATERSAREAGWRVDHVSSGRTGVDLTRELGDKIGGCRVLLPRSDRASGDLPRAIAEAGAEPVEVVAYRTIASKAGDPSVLAAIRAGQVDVASFASPSAFRAFVERMGEAAVRNLAGKTRFAAIGPTTAEAIREAGYAVEIEAKVATAAGLAAAIAIDCAAHPATKGRMR
jgi:uroporphyrinogen III methyltransferase/synthase